MGGLINLIKKLFSGILSFVGGIFNSKKSGYYLELDPADTGKPAVAPAKAEPAKAQPAKAEAPVPAQPAAATEPATTVSLNSVPAKADPVNAESVEAPVNAEPVAATATSNNGSSNGAKPTAPENPLNLPQPTVNFASEYLVPKPTNTRRRPGANMGTYLDMAKQVKTSNN